MNYGRKGFENDCNCCYAQVQIIRDHFHYIPWYMLVIPSKILKGVVSDLMTSTNLLPDTWKFWVILNGYVNGKKVYQIEEIFAFNTVESFWSYNAAIPKISDFKNVNGKKVSLALFRGDIKPAWEDPGNENGASCTFNVPYQSIDEFWETLMLYVIGGQMQKEIFGGKPEICGMFVRAGLNEKFSVEIWTKTSTDNSQLLADYIHEHIVPGDANLIELRDFRSHKSRIN